MMVFPTCAELAPVDRFIGGEWSYAMAQSPKEIIGYHTQERSMFAGTQIGRSFLLKSGKRVPDSLACIYYDPYKKTVRSVSISSRGTVTHAGVELSVKGSVWTSVDHIRGGPKQKSRVEIAWVGADAYKLRVYGAEGELSGELVGKRVKKS